MKLPCLVSEPHQLKIKEIGNILYNLTVHLVMANQTANCEFYKLYVVREPDILFNPATSSWINLASRGHAQPVQLLQFILSAYIYLRSYSSIWVGKSCTTKNIISRQISRRQAANKAPETFCLTHFFLGGKKKIRKIGKIWQTANSELILKNLPSWKTSFLECG